MLRDIFKGIIYYTVAIRYFFKFRLYKYLLLLLILLIIFAFPVVIFDFVINFLAGLIPYFKVQKYALLTVNMVAGISGFLLLLILSPVFSMVSEEVGKHLSGQIYRFSPVQLLKDIVRGIKISLRNMFYQYISIAVISISLYFLPEMELFHLFGNVLIGLITSYFYGFSILDYAMENYRMSYKASVQFVYQHTGLVIGLGLVYYLMISLNILLEGKLISPHFSVYWSAFSEAFVAFIGVIAASILMSKYKQNEATLQSNAASLTKQ